MSSPLNFIDEKSVIPHSVFKLSRGEKKEGEKKKYCCFVQEFKWNIFCLE